MEWIEVTGRTLEDAKEVALDELGVHESELEFEVLTEAKSGFLGVGRTEARIRARVKPISREKPDDRRRRKRRGGRDRHGGGRAKTAERRGGGEGGSGSRGAGVPDEGGPSRRRRRSRGRGTGAGRGRGGSTRATDAGGAGSDQDQQVRGASEGDSVESEMSLSDQQDAAVEFVQGLVDLFEVDATVEGAAVDEETLEVDVSGSGLGLLVGPRGATLSAIEDLTRAVVQRTTGGHSARVRVDVGGYRRRRREALEDFARTVAGEVLDTGEERVLEPMSPTDRKTVHDAVAELDGLATASVGEEPRRRVVIRPA